MDERPYGGTGRAAASAPAPGEQPEPEGALADQSGAAPASTTDPASAEQALAESGIDLLGMDLESLRTVEHPVLSALVSDLRERSAVAGGEALWGFESDPAAPEPTR